MASTEGKIITCKAAIAMEIGQPLVVDTIQVALPQKGEARVKILASGVCHSDSWVHKGGLPLVKFPIILGHEAIGEVESVGPGVHGLKKGDYVITLFMPECKDCPLCLNPRTNICQNMPKSFECLMMDGTSRVTVKGKPVSTMCGLGTFSEYIVSPEMSLCKIKKVSKPEEVCLFSCCIPTGYGAAAVAAEMEEGTTCAIWGLGGVGMAVILGCKERKASKIIGVDINSDKFEKARKLGCTDFINSLEKDKTASEKIVEMTNGGVDYAYLSVGNVDCMHEAFKALHPACGKLVLIGLPPTGAHISVPIMEVLLGKKIIGTYYGGYRPKSGLPQLVEKYLNGELPVNEFISHRLKLDEANDALELMRNGKSLRSVLLM